MQKKYKLSIITVCLNSSAFIETAIKSVLSQSFKDIEYLVLDGASTDGTVEILKRYQQENKLKYISEPDAGVYYAMNKGLKMVQGEWIFFLGSDDVFFDNEVLERIFSKEYGEEEIIYGNVKYLHSGIIYDGPFNHEKISTKNICHQAMFVKAAVFEKIGNFNTKYKMSADFEFNTRWMGMNLPSLYIDETIVIFNEKGLSGQVWDKVLYYDFDNILIENNIVCKRSFIELKRRYKDMANSLTFKIGNFFVYPFSLLKNKLKH
jgi:glycosyltransferase involved in cell wall biosynthesis